MVKILMGLISMAVFQATETIITIELTNRLIN